MMATELADQCPNVGAPMEKLIPHTRASFKIQVCLLSGTKGIRRALIFSGRHSKIALGLVQTDRERDEADQARRHRGERTAVGREEGTQTATGPPRVQGH